jgi:hypothetical protein
MDNHKRIERVYREEGLQVRRRKRKRVARATPRRVVEVPELPNERWSMDFEHDALAGGRQFKVLTIVDDLSKESPAIVVGQSISGHHVVEVLERLREERPLPREIVMDNGSEFTSLALDQRALSRRVLERELVREFEGCEEEDRSVAGRLQQHPPSQLLGSAYARGVLGSAGELSACEWYIVRGKVTGGQVLLERPITPTDSFERHILVNLDGKRGRLVV